MYLKIYTLIDALLIVDFFFFFFLQMDKEQIFQLNSVKVQ